jgi:hypothetical protein
MVCPRPAGFGFGDTGYPLGPLKNTLLSPRQVSDNALVYPFLGTLGTDNEEIIDLVENRLR